MNVTITDIGHALLKENQYFQEQDLFKMEISSHPDYPSLYALTDTYSKLGVQNMAARVDKEIIEELPNSFIATLRDAGIEEIVYAHKTNDGVRCLSEHATQNFSKEEFIDKWSGVVVVVEPNAKGKSLLTSKKKNYWMLVITLLASICYFFVVNATPANMVFIGLLIGGIMLSTLLVQEKLGLAPSYVDKFCQSGKNIDCKAVINSEGANLFKSVSLTDLSMLYFSAILINMVVDHTSLGASHITFLLGVGAVASMFSWVYQKVYIKKWCVLCLGISAIILISFFVNINNFYYSSYSDLALLAFSSAIAVLLWTTLSQGLKATSKVFNLESQLLKLKRHEPVMKALFSPVVSDQLEALQKMDLLTYGSDKSKNMVYLILSPSCNHCKKAFDILHSLFKSNLHDICLKIVMNSNPDNTSNPYQAVFQTINNLGASNKQIGLDAVVAWYESDFDLNLWLEKYRPQTSASALPWVDQYNWCVNNEIHYTPAIIINNKIFPIEYDIEDIRHFIE